MSNDNYFIEDLQKATRRLAEVLKMPKTKVNRDSAIKRFELCFDLAWKAIKFYAREHGKECFSPRACFKEAYQLGLIEYEKDWLEILKDRNLTAHLYKESMADQVYSRLSDYLEMFKKLIQSLQNQ